MTLREAADLLGLNPATLRQQVLSGKLKARKLGRDWHVTPGEVERYRSGSRRLPLDQGFCPKGHRCRPTADGLSRRCNGREHYVGAPLGMIEATT